MSSLWKYSTVSTKYWSFGQCISVEKTLIAYKGTSLVKISSVSTILYCFSWRTFLFYFLRKVSRYSSNVSEVMTYKIVFVNNQQTLNLNAFIEFVTHTHTSLVSCFETVSINEYFPTVFKFAFKMIVKILFCIFQNAYESQENFFNACESSRGK